MAEFDPPLSRAASKLLASARGNQTDGAWLVALSDACRADPGVAAELAVRRLRGDQRLLGEPLHKALTSLVPTGHLAGLVDAALRQLESGGEESAAEDVLDLVAIPSPEAFHGQLDRLFEQVVRLRSRRPSHVECNNATRAWRRSGLTHLDALRSHLKRGVRQRRIAWHALFWTREREAIECARSTGPVSRSSTCATACST